MGAMRRLLAAALAAALAPGLGADARTAFYEGQLSLEEGRYAEAGRSFSQAGREGYPAAKVHLGMGLCYLGLGQPSRAADHLEKALAGGEGDASVRAKLARALVAADRPDAALAVIDALLAEPELEPDPELNLMRGRILLARKQYMPAYEELKRALRAFPDEVLELAEQFPMEMDEALNEAVRLAAAEPEPAVDTAATSAPVEALVIPGLNRVGGVVGPSAAPPPAPAGPAPVKSTGGGMHVIKSKASRGTKVGAN